MSYIPKAVQRRVRTQARHRCGYCLSSQKYILGKLEMEHIDPLTGRRVKLFNPRRQQWTRHFTWSADGARIIGLTACGRATVDALQLNNVFSVTVRREWVKAGWHPPED